MDFWDWGATESEDEPDNRVDKYTVCMEKDKKVVGQLKKGDSGKFAKTFSTSWEVIHTPAVLQQFQGKDAIWKTEGLQVPCKLDMTATICKYFKTKIA